MFSRLRSPHPRHEFHALSTHSLIMSPHLTQLSHPSFKTYFSPPSSPTPGIRQGNLELTVFPHSLENTRNTNMLYWPHPDSTLFWAKPRTKWCNCSQPWGNVNMLFLDDSIASTNKIKVYGPLILNTNFMKRVLILGFQWELNSSHLLTNAQL